MKPSTACPSRDRLLEMVWGTNTALQVETFETHLIECPSCNAVVAAAMESDPLAKLATEAGWPPKPVDLETKRLSHKIAAEVETRLNATMETFVSTPVKHKAELDLSWLEPGDSPDHLGRLGDFLVLRPLGRGGMGVVFEAEDTRLRRKVAIKVILPGVSAEKSLKERFLREARSAAAVHHPHVVTIFEVGESRDVPYLAMELLHGESLQELLQQKGPLAPSEAANIAAQVAEGLAAAHQKGTLHRDIKPGNIMLQKSELDTSEQNFTVKLLDFGLAKPMGAEDGLTKAGIVVGTLKYLSPEQARGAKLDARSDLFSLGCMLYQMLSGAFPFEGKDPISQLNALATADPIAIRSRVPKIPDSLADLIHRLLARNVNDRPASAKEVAAELRRIHSELVKVAVSPPLNAASRSSLSSGTGGSGIRRRIGIFTFGFVPIAILLGIIVITMRHRDGTETQIEIDIRDHANNMVSKSSAAQEPLPATNKPTGTPAENSLPTITLNHLDASLIPDSEKFDWQPKELVAVIGEHQLRHWGRVGQVRFHPSGRFFITCSDHGPASLWMTSTLERREDAFVEDVAQSLSFEGFEFSQDGKWLSSANRIHAIDLTDGDRPRITLAQTLSSGDNRFGSSDVAIHGSRWLVMASDTPGELLLWDIASNSSKFIKSIPFDAKGGVKGLSWSSDGSRVVLSCWDGAVRVFDVDWKSAETPQFNLHSQQIKGGIATISPVGSVMASGGEGYEQIELWDVSQTPFKLLDQIEGGREFVFSPDGKRLAVAAGLGILLYAEEDGTWTRKSTMTEGMAAVLNLAWAPDQKSLVAGDQFGGIHVWDVSTDSPKSRLRKLPASNIQGLTLAPNGKSMMVVGSDNQAACWNLAGTAPLREDWSTYCEPGHLPSYALDSKHARVHDHIWSLGTKPPSNISNVISVLARFDPGENCLVSLNNATLYKKTWELTNRGRFTTGNEEVLWKSVGPVPSNDAMDTLQFASRRFATRDDEQTISVWSLNHSDKPLYELKHNLRFGSGVCPLSLSSDGTVLLAFSQQGSLIWDLEETPPREYPVQLHALTGNAFFSKDNKQLYIADANGMVVYDWVNNREVRRLTYPGPVRQIVPHPDNVHLATVNGNGTVYILRMPDASDR